MSRLDEETLLAYVDGQLDARRAAEVEARLADDPEARETVRLFRESAALLQGRFDAPLREPVPERLLATLRDTPASGTDNGRLLRFPDRRGARSPARPRTAPALAMAASLALVVGFGAGYLLPGLLDTGNGTPLMVQRTLETTGSGITVSWRDDDQHWQITPMVSFQAADGRYCREYEQLLSRDQLSHYSTGIACREADGRWLTRIEIDQSLLGAPMEDDDDQYLPASGPGADLLTEIGVTLGADAPLTPERENRLLQSSWQAR